MKTLMLKTIAIFLTIVLLGGSLIIGARNITRATQTGPPPCELWPRPECFPREERPVCPLPYLTPCPLESAEPGATMP